MNWGAKPALTVTGKDGKTLEVRSLKYAATEIKAHIGGMKQGGEYLFTITDPSGKVASLSGSFLVHEMPDSDDADDDD